MKLVRRGLFRNVYLAMILLLFICYIRNGGEFGWHRHKKEVAEGNDSERYEENNRKDLRRHQDRNVFPDSGLVPGVVYERIDWHNRTRITLERARKGPGEQGRPHHLSPVQDQQKQDKEKQDLYDTNGFNALLSDEIALDRALRDNRHEKCDKTLYSAKLPTVSVVIPFFEEHWTTLLRTVVSVRNRSPPSLLREIVLVDDGSTMKDFLKEPLDKWLAENVPIAYTVRLPTRVGLIVARQEGAKHARGDVIVVLDSHCEVMINWLPPLLDLIAADYRTVVCPLIDSIDSEDFHYSIQDNGARGGFDWRFFYKRLPLRPYEEARLPEPFENPVMNGGLFAISRTFFWELGGYDTGLAIWGGEQYDLSFKIWQCNGRMLDAPCSRVGHIFRHGGKKRPSVSGDYLSQNYRRVAEVWMDEYAEALYRKNPHLRTVDPGDISHELEIRKNLQCKSFKWYLENVAPDMVKTYPPFEPPNFANGTIQCVAAPELCMDNGGRENGHVILYPCHGGGTQYFSLCWRKTLRIDSEQFCFSSPQQAGQSLVTRHCSLSHVNSMTWRYDPETQQLQTELHGWCAEAVTKDRTVVMAKCDGAKVEQRWEFKNVNKKLIAEQLPPFPIT